MILGAVAHYSIQTLTRKKRNLKKNFSNEQQRERIPGKAWVLVVTLTFKNMEDQKSILEAWKPVTEYCGKKESFLYHYEAGQNDADPLKLHITERYETKDHYLNAHKTGEEFLKFRPKLKALQDEGKVTVEGFSYKELGVGFV